MINTHSKKYLSLAGAFIAAVVLTTATSHATVATIQLFNTGVSSGGGLLSDATIDPHYSVIAAPSPYTTAYTGNGFDVGLMPWLPDGPNSRWIGVTPWMGEWRPTGTYIFSTTFDLSGLIPGSAAINLNIASDNTCDIFLNGVHTGITTPFAGFDSFSTYSVSSGFIDGVNTLDFQVSEPGSTPSGLRVEMTGYATTVPEPTVLGLAGLATVLLVSWRRKQVP